MSKWDDDFENHAVFTSLENVRQRLEALGEGLDDAEGTEAHARLARVVDYLDRSLKDADPELVPPGLLDQIVGELTPLATALEQYEATPEQAYLDQASSYADALIGQARQLSPRASSDGSQDLQSAVTTFRRSAGQHLRNIEEAVEEIRGKADAAKQQLDAQETKMEAQDARLDGVVTDFQAQFSTAEEQRRADFSQVVEEGRAQLREAVETTNTAAKEAVEEAQSELNELLEKTKSDTDQALNEVKSRADEQFAGFSTAGTERVEQLDELLRKAVKTVGVIGSTGMASGYQQVAKNEKKSADFWRWVTVAGLLGAIGATIFAVAHGVTHGFAVDTFFAKWAISVPFAALAAYAGHESSKHRDEERINRQIELQLASLDAYLVTLPEPEQNRVRAKLADRFFGELKPGATEETPPEPTE